MITVLVFKTDFVWCRKHHKKLICCFKSHGILVTRVRRVGGVNSAAHGRGVLRGWVLGESLSLVIHRWRGCSLVVSGGWGRVHWHWCPSVLGLCVRMN